MDSNVDDRMIRQIETGLSNNLNDNLFTTGTEKIALEKTSLEKREDDFGYFNQPMNQPINDLPPLSRAEYIRQAREACLRQMNASSYHSHSYDSYTTDSEIPSLDKSYRKKIKGLPLIRSGDRSFPAWAGNRIYEENSPEEIASFRALIIRMVCAVVIFLFLFAIDKFDIKIGKFTSDMVQEYVTGKDLLKELEVKLVTWLK
ncbi:MAG: hypothetical protein GX306_05880 [Clostridiales bacterium]|jgi:hypothetical protein|nr:hypothetical protein [Clostridiales bacterium]